MGHKKQSILIPGFLIPFRLFVGAAGEALAQVKKDRAAVIAAYDRVSGRILRMADVFNAGVTKRLPREIH